MSHSSSLSDLCQFVKQSIPDDLNPGDTWYLFLGTALVYFNRHAEFSELWKHITSASSEPLSFAEKQRHSLRVREMLMKEWTIVGIPLVVLALTALATAQKDDFDTAEQREEAGKLSEKWQSPEPISPSSPVTARGTKCIQTLYRDNISPIFSSWGTHSADFEAMEKSVLYGLFLSDMSILSPLETEIVVWTSIAYQGLRAPTLWHLRGLRRLGVSREHAGKLVYIVKEVAKWCGRNDAEGWAGVDDLDESDVNAD